MARAELGARRLQSARKRCVFSRAPLDLRGSLRLDPVAGSLLDLLAAEVTVERFEYCHLNVDVSELVNASFDERLTTLGRDGWQLVTTIAPEKHGYSHAVHFIFVRRMS